MTGAAPDLLEKVIGYRSWSVTDDGHLVPVTVKSRRWQPGVNHAVCDEATCRALMAPALDIIHGHQPVTWEPHRAPRDGCHCGFYAHHRPNQGVSHSPWVQGVIAAWGTLEVHHHGFRAEVAEVLALAEPAPDSSQRHRDALAAAARRYNVPLIPAGELAAVAREHGSPVPETLRPPLPRDRTPAVPSATSDKATAWLITLTVLAVAIRAGVISRRAR